MVQKILVPLWNLEIPKKHKDLSFLIFEITTNKEEIEMQFGGHLYNERNEPMEFTETIQNCSTFAYVKFQELAQDSEQAKIMGQNLIARVLEIISTCFWLVKDNIISSDVVFFEEGSEQIVNVYKANFPHEKTNCQFTNSSVLFTLKELERTSLYFHQFSELTLTSTSNDLNKEIIHPTNRIARAFYFISMARGARHIPLKITFYMSVFDCLFAMKETEVTHKIAERTAFYLKAQSEHRQKIYAVVNKGYALRSRFIHGDPLEKDSKYESMLELSKQLDDILRETMQEILLFDSDIFSQPDMSLFYKKLIFREKVDYSSKKQKASKVKELIIKCQERENRLLTL